MSRFLLAVAALVAALPLLAADARNPLRVTAATRLLVIAPHPDDEVLGAGGLIQRVRSSGGSVRVVYLTNGDAYKEGVQATEHVATPSDSDYRDYGRHRQGEAREALEVLGIESDALTFLGFPNGGLSRLMRAYWSDRRAPFTSPYTRLDRPKSSDVVVPNSKYRGEDLTQELAVVMGRFAPTTIVVTRKEDEHVDHCAAWFFAADALGDVQRVRNELRPDVLTYIIHYGSWPFESESPNLVPPSGLPPGPGGWLNLRLTAAETARKRSALDKYESQMKMMKTFLLGFAKPNELFSRPDARRVVLPIARNPCAALEAPAPKVK